MVGRRVGFIGIATVIGAVLAGCTSSRMLPDGDGSISADAAVVADTSPSGDAAPLPRDAMPGTDAGWTGPPRGLLAALRCYLSERQAVDAILRQIACNDSFTEASELLRRWDELEFGSPVPNGVMKACEEWQCLATATSCEEAAACRYLGYTERSVGCESTDAYCDGSIRTMCVGGSFRHAFDCADVGATCVDGNCQVDDCRIGDFATANCTATEGREIGLGCGVVDTCEAECISTGSGEVYYGYCGPPRELPSIVCHPGGELTIRMVRSEDLTYDCAAHGYSTCNTRGCIP